MLRDFCFGHRFVEWNITDAEFGIPLTSHHPSNLTVTWSQSHLHDTVCLNIFFRLNRNGRTFALGKVSPELA